MPMADSVLSTPPLTYEAVATTSAPGALSLCRPLVIRDSRLNASQASGAEGERSTERANCSGGPGASMTRRSIMNMMVGAAAITVAAPAQDAFAQNADRELCDLAQRLQALLPDYNAAVERIVALWEEYEKRAPDRSDVLRWRPADPVGYVREKLPGDRCQTWCNHYDIEMQRGVIQYEWSLKQENEEEFFALPEDDHLREYDRPKAHVQHLFSKKPSEWKQNRVNKLNAAADEYRAAGVSLEKQLGLPEAEQFEEDLYAPILEIVDRMEAIEPLTIAGFQAKAMLLLKWHWADRPRAQLGWVEGKAFALVCGLATAKLAA